MFKSTIDFIINLFIIFGLGYLGKDMGLSDNAVIVVIVLQFVFMAKMILGAFDE